LPWWLWGLGYDAADEVVNDFNLARWELQLTNHFFSNAFCCVIAHIELKEHFFVLRAIERPYFESNVVQVWLVIGFG
jgi:hypothetical protein